MGRHVLLAAISATRWAISAAVGLTFSTPSSWLSSPTTAWMVWSLNDRPVSCVNSSWAVAKGTSAASLAAGLLQVPWRAALGQLEGVIQGREALLTLRDSKSMGRDRETSPTMVCTARGGAGRAGRSTLTVGTRQDALVQHWRMPLCHQGFGDLARQLLAQGKHRLRQLLQAGSVLGHVGLHSIQPTVQVCMQLLAGLGLGKGLSEFPQRRSGLLWPSGAPPSGGLIDSLLLPPYHSGVSQMPTRKNYVMHPMSSA